jgi:hypothetical protein
LEWANAAKDVKKNYGKFFVCAIGVSLAKKVHPARVRVLQGWTKGSTKNMTQFFSLLQILPTEARLFNFWHVFLTSYGWICS